MNHKKAFELVLGLAIGNALDKKDYFVQNNEELRLEAEEQREAIKIVEQYYKKIKN